MMYYYAMAWFFGTCMLAPIVGAWMDRKGGQ